MVYVELKKNYIKVYLVYIYHLWSGLACFGHFHTSFYVRDPISLDPMAHRMNIGLELLVTCYDIFCLVSDYLSW